MIGGYWGYPYDFGSRSICRWVFPTGPASDVFDIKRLFHHLQEFKSIAILTVHTWIFWRWGGAGAPSRNMPRHGDEKPSTGMEDGFEDTNGYGYSMIFVLRSCTVNAVSPNNRVQDIYRLLSGFSNEIWWFPIKKSSTGNDCHKKPRLYSPSRWTHKIFATLRYFKMRLPLNLGVMTWCGILFGMVLYRLMSGKDGFARAPRGNMGSQLMSKIPDYVQPCRSLPLVDDSFRKRPAQTIGRNNLHPKPRFVEKAISRLSFNWWLPEHALIPVRYKRGWVLVGSDFAYLQRCGSFFRHGSDQHMKIQDVFGAGLQKGASSKRNPGSKLLRWTTFFANTTFVWAKRIEKPELE